MCIRDRYDIMLNQHSIEKLTEIHNLLQNIQRTYEKSIKLMLLKKVQNLYINPHTIPKIKKIEINRGLGHDAQKKLELKKNISEFEKITGQKPIIAKTKKAIAGFKIREDMEVGLSLTLRHNKMYSFLIKLIFFTFAQIRDFRGLSIRNFDKAGNFTFGLKEQLIFPEIDYDDVDQARGCTISIVIENCLSKSSVTLTNKIFSNMILLNFFHFPFNDFGNYNKYLTISEINQIWDKKRAFKRKRWSQE